jgi:hypothetical protein
MRGVARVIGSLVLLGACAGGGARPGDLDGGTRDVGVSDTGAPDTGVPDTGAPDTGAPDTGIDLTNGDTCDPCANADNCMPGYYCMPLSTGESACMPVCNIDLPDCPPRFDCVTSFNDARVDEPICAPVGERCCVDSDGDLHGQGVGCLGIDCDESSTATNSSATEVCDGNDNDCDGMIDEGDPNALCPRGVHVAVSECALGECENRECEPGFGDCDDDRTTGCEQQTDTLMHCGGCFVGCTPPNATGDCSTGTCDIGTCNDGFADCDGDPVNGCETPLNTNSNCGGCDVECAPASAIGECSTGTCTIASCNPRRGDCDGNVANGCETTTTTNSDCGGCGVLCAPTNAVGECSTGTCRVVTCTRSDVDDCDGLASNGCETSLRTNTDCAGCGVMCSIPGGSASCASGSCQLTGCPMGFGNCDGNGANGCEQPLNTTTHCGDCRVPCAPPNGTGSCASGGCTIVSCNPGWDDCDGDVANGCETPLNTLTSCGTCGTSCALANASETCATSMCRIESCDPGFGHCDGSQANGCETNLRTNSNCGGCGVTCSRPGSTTSCATGVCSWTGCNAGFSSCDGDTANGCEVGHAATSGACGGGVDVGTYDGDRSCGFICGSNTGWTNFATHTGRTSAWFRGRVREDSTCSTDIEHRIRLAVPDGVDYDLRVYRSTPCGTPVASSTTPGNGTDEEVIVRQAENSGSDDDFDYYVHVVYAGGAACATYEIRFDGHNC